MATENFNEFLKRIKEHPYSFGEYDGDDLDDDESDDDDEIDVSPNSESLFEKYKKELEAKKNKK